MTVIHLKIKVCISALELWHMCYIDGCGCHTSVFLEEPLGPIVPLSQLTPSESLQNHVHSLMLKSKEE